MLLQIDSGSRRGSTVEVVAAGLVVGREPTCGLVLSDDPRVSRQHARFDRAATGGLMLIDLGSANGTFVDDRRVVGPTELRGGERVTIGETVVVVPAGPAPPMVAVSPAAATTVSPPAPAAPPPVPAAEFMYPPAPAVAPWEPHPDLLRHRQQAESGHGYQPAPPAPPPGGDWQPDPRAVAGPPLAAQFAVGTVPDPWFLHYLRYAAVWWAMFLASLPLGIPSLLWSFHMANTTGFRKRDVINPVASVRAMWRHTARSVYWEPRSDRPSKILSGGARTAAISGGAAVAGLFLVIAAVVAAIGGRDGDGGSNSGWSTSDQQELFEQFGDAGVDPETAECAVGVLVDRFPDGPYSVEGSEAEAAIQSALMTCAGSG